MKLLIATKNKGKLPEIEASLDGLSVELLSLKDITDFPEDFEVEEPADSFEGNAIIKAMIIGRKTGHLTLADDSGLEVHALGGRPGVYSKRYGESDEGRRAKLLAELEETLDDFRNAQFRCAIAIYDPKTDKIRTCEGVCPGMIIRDERGENGFGYDPIFWHEERGMTTAEMSMEIKNEISHRGKALKEARKILQNEFLI